MYDYMACDCKVTMCYRMSWRAINSLKHTLWQTDAKSRAQLTTTLVYPGPDAASAQLPFYYIIPAQITTPRIAGNESKFYYRTNVVSQELRVADGPNKGGKISIINWLGIGGIYTGCCSIQFPWTAFSSYWAVIELSPVKEFTTR